MLVRGQSFEVDGQAFFCERLEPYERRNGQLGQLAILQARCKRCGAPYLTSVPAFHRVERIRPRSRCQAHQRRTSDA